MTVKFEFRDDTLEDFRSIGRHSEMRITTENGDWISFSFREGGIEISARRPIVLQARAANVFAVRCERESNEWAIEAGMKP